MPKSTIFRRHRHPGRGFDATTPRLRRDNPATSIPAQAPVRVGAGAQVALAARVAGGVIVGEDGVVGQCAAVPAMTEVPPRATFVGEATLCAEINHWGVLTSVGTRHGDLPAAARTPPRGPHRAKKNAGAQATLPAPAPQKDDGTATSWRALAQPPATRVFLIAAFAACLAPSYVLGLLAFSALPRAAAVVLVGPLALLALLLVVLCLRGWQRLALGDFASGAAGVEYPPFVAYAYFVNALALQLVRGSRLAHAYLRLFGARVAAAPC